MDDDHSPTCWTWPVTEDDMAAAQSCPEKTAHVLLWNWQRGLCACCGIRARGYWKLVRDHDHATGLLRGLLCTACNVMEGQTAHYGTLGVVPAAWSDGIQRMYWRGELRKMRPIEAMGLYRGKNPATMLGVQARYTVTDSPKLPPEFDAPIPIRATA